MIKLVMCLHRHPKMSRAEFLDYWQNKHAPLFQEHAGTMRAKRYVQSQTVDTPLNEGFRASRDMQPEFDGVAEVWFESEEDLMAAVSSPEGQERGAILHADEQNFIDHSRSSAFIVREVEL